MTKLIITTLALAASAGTVLAEGTPNPYRRGAYPVIRADGMGGFQRAGGLVNFDFATAESWDSELDSSNEVHFITVTETAPMTSITWGGTITTVGASWLSEATIYFGAPDPSQSFYLTMGIDDNFSGTGTYSGSADIVAALGFPINAAGTWEIEFFESFDDVSDSIDAHWRNVTVGMVPAPGAAALLGMGALVAGRRRR